MTEMTVFAEITGSIGMICSVSIAFAMIFQISRIIKRRSSRDISLILFCAAILSYSFWFLHGISIHNIFMMVTQGSGLTFASITLVFALKYRRGLEERTVRDMAMEVLKNGKVHKSRFEEFLILIPENLLNRRLRKDDTDNVFMTKERVMQVRREEINKESGDERIDFLGALAATIEHHGFLSRRIFCFESTVF